MKLKECPFNIFIMLITFISCVAKAEVFSINSATILQSDYKANLTVHIPVSPILYKEASDIHQSSGFYAENEIVNQAILRTKLLDYPKKYNVTAIFNRVKQALVTSGYDILYQCVGQECGKKDGYRLYFSTRLNDSGESQSYVVALHKNTYNAFYIADIDGQPRAFFAEATINKPDRTGLSNNLIPFELGSAELTVQTKNIIDSWLVLVGANAKEISIIGHADASGKLEKNIQLAEARASAVKEYVQQKTVGKDIKILSFSAANLARPLNGSRGRYVELAAHNDE